MTSRSHRLLIPLAAFLAILPLLLHGPSCGHDFDFHLLNWLEVNTQLHHLQWPTWAYTPAYNAGEPRFLFYPPLSWLLGAALTAILPFHYVPIAFTWIALTLSGLALHRLAKPYTSPQAATFAATLYLANPYMLFTAYERTAYAELLAAAFIPLLFAAILTPRPKIPAIAIPLALLWLTNAPAAVMSTYALALLTCLRLMHRDKGPTSTRSQLAFTSIIATTLGLTLAAFYILPAALNRHYVQISMVVISGMNPADNTLFHHTPDPDHDVVLHTASLIAILLLTATAAAFVATKLTAHSSKLSAEQKPLSPASELPLAVLATLIAILLTPLSLPIWHYTPQLAFLQFPWRLLALLAPICCLLTAIALARIPRANFLIPPALAILILPAWHTFQQPCDLPDTPESRAALYHSPQGTEPTDEYTPADADPDALHPEDPPYWLLPQTSSINTPAPNAPAGPSPNHLTITAPAPEYLVLNRRKFPQWQVTLNHHPAPQQDRPLQREDGLIATPIPAGTDTIDLTLTHPDYQPLGLTLSLLALIILCLLLRRPSTLL